MLQKMKTMEQPKLFKSCSFWNRTMDRVLQNVSLQGMIRKHRSTSRPNTAVQCQLPNGALFKHIGNTQCFLMCFSATWFTQTCVANYLKRMDQPKLLLHMGNMSSLPSFKRYNRNRVTDFRRRPLYIYIYICIYIYKFSICLYIMWIFI